MAKTAKVSLDDLYQQIQSGEVKELKVVAEGRRPGLGRGGRRCAPAALDRRRAAERASTARSAASRSRTCCSRRRRTRSSSASTSGPEPKAAALAEREGVDIRLYTIIYEALNDVRDALEGLLEPTLQEKVLGRAEVRQTFSVSGVGHDRRLLRHRRQDRPRRPGAAAARPRRRPRRQASAACGASRTTRARWRAATSAASALENFQDVKVGDVIEAYEVEEVARRLPPGRREGRRRRPSAPA